MALTNGAWHVAIIDTLQDRVILSGSQPLSQTSLVKMMITSVTDLNYRFNTTHCFTYFTSSIFSLLVHCYAIISSYLPPIHLITILILKVDLVELTFALFIF